MVFFSKVSLLNEFKAKIFWSSNDFQNGIHFQKLAINNILALYGEISEGKESLELFLGEYLRRRLIRLYESMGNFYTKVEDYRKGLKIYRKLYGLFNSSSIRNFFKHLRIEKNQPKWFEKSINQNIND